MFRFPSVICTRCTGFFCLAIIKGPPNDIYCIIEEPSKHYFTEKVSYSRYLSRYSYSTVYLISKDYSHHLHSRWFILLSYKQMPKTRINTGFRHFSPLLKLGKSNDVPKYICLSFISFLPLFYFCCIYYFGSLIFCCQFVASLL